MPEYVKYKYENLVYKLSDLDFDALLTPTEFEPADESDYLTYQQSLTNSVG